MKISLQHHHALMVEDGAFSHKVDNFYNCWEILNVEGHPNRITGSRVMVILLNRWILPIGGASAVESLRSTGLLHLVSFDLHPHIGEISTEILVNDKGGVKKDIKAPARVTV